MRDISRRALEVPAAHWGARKNSIPLSSRNPTTSAKVSLAGEGGAKRRMRVSFVASLQSLME
jgi:hypothetical protein